MVNDHISPFGLYFILMSFVPIIVEIIREDEYSNQTTRANDIKNDATQCGTFL